MIDFRNIRSPWLTFRKFNCSAGFSSKYFNVIQVVGIWRFLNLDRACLRCLIASLQSSLYHGLLLVQFVEVLGIHSLDISIREEVKSDMGSEDSLKFSDINLPVHRVLNRSKLALFNFHFGLWSSVEKVFSSMMIGK